MYKPALLLSFLFSLLFACNSQKDFNEIPLDNNISQDTAPLKYELVWSDEFNYLGLPDSNKWSFDTEGNAWGWGNNEAQYYTNRNIENAYVDSDFLHIIAQHKKMTTHDFTSARLRTIHKGDWLFGKIEVKALLPQIAGIWPAIWMLPTDWIYGDWPNSGEIDIMEHVGYMPDSVFCTIHTEAYNHILNTQKSKGAEIPDLDEKFHLYSIEWTKDKIDFFIDSSFVFSFNNEHKTYKEWPFNQKFHLLLNVAVGGNWGGIGGIDTTGFPREMLIDYVRIYQKK